MVRRRWRLACRRASRVGFRKSASRGVISSAIRGAGTAVSLAAVTGLIRTNLQTHICRPVETIQWVTQIVSTSDNEDKAHEKPASPKEVHGPRRRGEGFLRSVRGSGRKLEGRVEKGEARKVFGGREGKGTEGKVTLGPTTFPWAHRRRITDNSRAYCISPIRLIHGEAVVCA
ncbi:hypothetical protein GW17_00020661 [Ensete ventricosum]|nr:hypothetical protein GW17_00020661 [Ensete ventricosum]